MAGSVTAEPVLTADDIVRLGGACVSGVHRLASRNIGKVAAAMPVSAILKLVPKADQHYVMKAAGQIGYGSGDGYGYGYGYGDGYGYGYGDGDGDGGFK